MLSIGKPNNQPLINYAQDEKEWQCFCQALEKLPRNLDIPLIIGDKEVYTDQKITSINPSTKEIVCTAQQATKQNAEDAVKAALAAKQEWASFPIETRIQKFRDLEQVLYERRHEICAANSLECGFIPIEVAGCWAEMMDFIRFNAYYYNELNQLKLGECDGETNTMLLRALKGFTVAITPFNFPVAIGYNLPTVMALCGNTVVWKPSSDAPLVSWILMKCIKDAGFPPGVFNMVTGPGRNVMPPVLSHPEVNAVNFTGSFEVAKDIGNLLYSPSIHRPHFPRLIAETGGKDFMIVDKNANVYDVASCIIAGAFGRSGQKCSANSLVLVDKAIWKDLKDAIVEQMKKFKMGNATQRDVNTGPVVNKPSFESITGFIKRAKEDKNCNIFVGGNFDDSKGFYIEPTFIEVNTCPHELLATEIFGPVVACHTYDSIEKATRVLDLSIYRLTGAVWSNNESWLAKYVPVFAEYAGNFYVNRKTTGAIVDQQPFGGDGGSGTNCKAGGMWYLLQFISQGVITRRHKRTREKTGLWDWTQA
jgi:1-pyrroline-5-carboxylate dehydrogenase